MSTDRGLLTFLHNYRRITPHRACEETKRMTVAPKLNVWVYANGGWALLDRRSISRLWYSDDPHRSLCHLLFRNVLRLSASQYDRLKTQLLSGKLSGMYKGPSNSYAIVIDLESDPEAKKRAIASGLGVLAAGVLLGGLYTQKDRFTGLVPNLKTSTQRSQTPTPNYSPKESLQHGLKTKSPSTVNTTFTPPRAAPHSTPKGPNVTPHPAHTSVNLEDLVHASPTMASLDNGSDRDPSDSHLEDLEDLEDLARESLTANLDQVLDQDSKQPGQDLRDPRAEVPLLNTNQPKFEISLNDNFFARFPKEDYNVDVCVNDGSNSATSLLVLAFYYFKILPADQQKTIYLHLDLLPDLDYEYRIDWLGFQQKRRAFQTSLNNFISSVPDTVRFGITLLRTVRDHSTLLIFDVTNNRLEYYDSNGRGVWRQNMYNEHATLYNYFVRNLGKIRSLHPRVCKVWSSDTIFQGADGSCAMWSTVFGICRMSGIERSQLPRDIQVVKNISRSIRDALWNTCQFRLFESKLYTKKAVEESFRECNVELAEIEDIRALVMENQQQELVAISEDVDICATQETEQKIDCADVVVDTYKNPLNPEQIKSRCVKNADKITFRGSPDDLQEQWLSLTNHIVLCPRSVFVDLNTIFKIMNAMEKHPRVHVEADVGIINLTRYSVLDRQHLIPRMTVNRVLILGALPTENEFFRKVKLLRLMTTPHMLLPFMEDGASNPEWRLRTHPLLQHFVLDETKKRYAEKAPWSDFLAPFVQRGAVSVSIDEFKLKQSGSIESPQACTEMTFGRPLQEEDVTYFMTHCRGKIESITFTCDVDHIPFSLSSLTDKLNFKIIQSERAITSIVQLLQRSELLRVHIEVYHMSDELQTLLGDLTMVKPRLTVDRMLLLFVPSTQVFFDECLRLAQTVFVTIQRGTDIERASMIGARYFLVRPGAKAQVLAHPIMVDPVEQKRVIFSSLDLGAADAPKNKIYPWIASDEVTFDLDSSPPTDRVIEEFKAICAQVRRSNVKDMSNEKIILTMANMTTDTLNVQHVNFNNDSPLIARVLVSQPTLAINIELAEFDMKKRFVQILNADRFRISKMIVRKQPATKEEYDRILLEIFNFADAVYQYVENGVEIDWLDSRILSGFVVDPSYNYESLLLFLTKMNITPRLFDHDLTPLPP